VGDLAWAIKNNGSNREEEPDPVKGSCLMT